MTLDLAKRFLRWAVLAALMVFLIYLLAGRTDLARLHAFVVVVAAVTLAAALRLDPEVVGERMRRGQKTTDPVRLALIRLGFLTQLVVSTLDVGRFHWSDSVPLPLGVVGLAALAASMSFVFWAISVNRFFLPVIRLQIERGHRTVDTGPYAIVRHPGYAGMVVAAPSAALALGSWWGFVLGIGLSLLFIWRTADEDRFLAGNLEGYASYRERVRFRLLPGVW